MRHFLALLMLALASGSTFSDDFQPCRASSPVGSVCEVALTDLRPTQFGVGLLQVMYEKDDLAKLSSSKLKKTVLRKRIAVVIGPDGDFWLVDRHHLSRALWELDERKALVSIVGRVNSRDGFWTTMAASHWAWLFDEQGNPRPAGELPRHIKDLPDYSYRSLAGFAENEHLFEKGGQVYFVEFAWARYFGEQLRWAKVNEKTLQKRLDEARRVACLPRAAGLPGYPGAVCRN